MLSCSVMSDSVTPWTVDHQAPLSMGILPARTWRRLPCTPSGDLPDTGIEPSSPTLQADSLPSEPPGKPKNTGVSSISLIQGNFPTQESNRGLLHCKQILYQLSYLGSPNMSLMGCNLDTVSIESTCLASDKADTEQTTLISNTRNQS